MKSTSVFILGAALVAAVGLGISCGKPSQAELQETIIPVELAQVTNEAVAPPIYGSGLLFSKQQIRLSFKTGGIVKSILANEGQNVPAGQVLAKLDLDEINAQVQQATLGYEKAQRDFARVENLYADSVVTLEQRQNAETQLRVAESTLRIAQFNLEYSTIKAPAAGRILKRFVEPGELVAPGTPIFYFGAGREEWLVRMGLADRDIIQLQIGDSAWVEFDAYPNTQFPARVTEIAQAADPQNGTFEAEVTLVSPGLRLAAGFVANVTITPGAKQSHKLVPLAALVNANGADASVFTVAGDSARQAPVTIGPILGERVVVLAGLEGIDAVVTSGAPYLKTGDRVRVR